MMPIPSKEVFESFIRQATWNPKQEWIDAAANMSSYLMCFDELMTDVYSAKLGAAKQESRAIFNEFLDAVQTLEGISQKLKRMEEFGRWGPRTPFVNSPYFQREKARVTQLANSQPFFFPMGKITATSRERVLLFDVANALRWRFIRDKTQAIYDLMTTDGVKNHLNDRTIDRALAAWRRDREEQRNRR